MFRSRTGLQRSRPKDRGVGRQDHSTGKRTWNPHQRGPGPDGGPLPARFSPGNPPFRLHRGCRDPGLCLFHEQSLVFITREERVGKNSPSTPPSWKVFLSQGGCTQGREFHLQRRSPGLSNRFEPSVQFVHFRSVSFLLAYGLLKNQAGGLTMGHFQPLAALGALREEKTIQRDRQ